MKRATLIPMAIVLAGASLSCAGAPPAAGSRAAMAAEAGSYRHATPPTTISPSCSEPASAGRLGRRSERLQQISDRWFVKLVRLQDDQVFDRIARQNGRLHLLERAVAAVASITKGQPSTGSR